MPLKIIGNNMQMGQLNSFVLVQNQDGTWSLTSNNAGETDILIVENTGTGSPLISLRTPTQNWSLRVDSSTSLFHIRDVTGGNLSPFKIEPGTPTNTLYLDSTGNVGIGLTNPATLLELSKTQNLTTEARIGNSDAVGASARAGIRLLASTANTFIESYGAGNTTSRLGITLANYSNLHQISGSGLIISVNGANPLIFGTNNVEALRIDSNGNIIIGNGGVGTNGVGVLSIKNGTSPTTGPADCVQFYSSDDAAGHTIPSFYCEGTNVVATGQADIASSVRVKMRINGTVRTFLCI